jgi:hypothetical protein
MKKAGLILLMLCISVAMAGCIVQSLHPFYTEDALIELPQIHGEWLLTRDDSGDVSGANIPPWRFTSNRIKAFDGRSLEAKLEVKYFSIEDTVFIDITAGDPFTSSVNEIWAMHVAPVHTAAKVTIKKDTLILTPLNYDWIDAALNAKETSLPIIKLESAKMTVFNANSETWMAFLKEHKDDREIFAEKLQYVFKRMR